MAGRVVTLTCIVALAATYAGAAGGREPASGPPFRAVVDMATFMDHVLTPAATVVWHSNGYRIDATGEHDLSPRTDEEWEAIVNGAATLSEATNALMIPQRARDRAWNGYVVQLAVLAEQAYLAAERHDLRQLGEVSDRLDAACTACHHHYGLE